MSKMNICKIEENWTCRNIEVVVDNPLKTVKLKTRAPSATDRSPEYNEHFCYKLDYPQHLTYFYLTWIRPLADMAETSYCVWKAMSPSSLPYFNS